MKIFGIGRNYAAHARELNNEVPEEPIVFLMPPTALLINDRPFYFPDFSNEIHFEAEVVIRICKNGKHVQKSFAREYYDKVAFGIDFTARDLQQQAKAKGQPWAIAKGFDFSAAISDFIPAEGDKSSLGFELRKNEAVVQKGNTDHMIFSFEEIIVYVSRFFKLQQGDLIYTGTPAGVGPIAIGDVLEGFIDGKKMLRCEIK